MAGLAAENERLTNLVAQKNCPPSLSGERLKAQSLPDERLNELLRLRGEVGVRRQQSKELETLRNENRQARAALDRSLKASNPGPAGIADREIALPPSQLQILKAEYWTEKTRLDVAEELRRRIMGDKLEAIASNELKGDPEFGTVKKLTVEYRFNGVTVTNEFTEGERIAIPPEPK